MVPSLYKYTMKYFRAIFVPWQGLIITKQRVTGTKLSSETNKLLAD